ncbi:MAG TPA: LuxR C-terminal-related transcriptional regulator [Acidimicrobiales bacterium]|nr:LuxR C-terminal-related transcriptional regulator [Acidimicrobiales bacterium]
MARAGIDRAVSDLVARCHVGVDANSLISDVVARLRRVLTVDAAFGAPVDPATLLFTGAVLWQIPPEAASQFLSNEYLEDDVNKFRSLASERSPAATLDGATGNHRPGSARYREIMAPMGLGDELRVALRSGGVCWGFLCLHREEATAGFTEAETRLVTRVAPHVGEGLRRALLVGEAIASPESHGPGILVLDADGSLVATTPAGDRWLWELAGPDQPVGSLPVAVEAVLARLKALRGAAEPLEVQPRVRVRTRSGRWAVLHASEMAGLGARRHTAVVVEPAAPTELAPIILLAYGLTPREAEVARLVLQGKPTKVISWELRISQHTVEDHLKAIFNKVGVGSRGELTARVLSEHYSREPKAGMHD